MRRTVGRRWTAAAAGAAAVLTLAMAPRPAGALANLDPVMPVMDCSAVAGLNLTGVTDAPVTIRSAAVVTTEAAAPFCAVVGTIAPAVTIVMRLPTQGWTQRYLQTGCGGLCGTAEINYIQAAACAPVGDGTIASATTDMGHQGKNDGSWADGNPQAKIDFAYRGVHVTSQVAKAIITRFYGRPPKFNYFDGCSDGGREALMEAQRYPDDFDGIAAGAAASNFVTQNKFHHAWNVLANKDANGNYTLLAGKLPMVHAAVVDACDKMDGVTDGLIEDPRLCKFDPYSIVCKARQDPATCLTKAEAGVVRRLHNGATDGKGLRLEQYISHEWGSELDWTLFVPSNQGETTGSEGIALAFMRYLAFFNVAEPNLQLADLEFTKPSFWKAVQVSTYLAATDPDLTRFRSRGGKLLLWHGWSDQHISPQATLSYYDAMRKTMGHAAVDSFVRLYLFPGVAHCSGGLGPNTFDVLTPVMDWVESNSVPGKIVASSVTNGTVTRTRPVFPFPLVARYVGSGSTDDEANFVAAKPEKQAVADYRWLGQVLYSHGYQSTCRAVDGKLACRPGRVSLPGKAPSA